MGSRDLIRKERKGMKDMSGKEESQHILCLIHLGVNHHLPMLRKVQRWEKRRTGGCLGENKERKGRKRTCWFILNAVFFLLQHASFLWV